MNLDLIKNKIRNIPDFPKPGIQYKDINVLQNYDVFQKVINLFYDEFNEKNIDVVVGIESRDLPFSS